MTLQDNQTGKKRRVQMRDIAEHAGVAVSSVSRVLNQSGSVSSELEQKVLQAARELGYPLLKREAQLKLRNILLCSYWQLKHLHEFYASIIGGVESECNDLGCHMNYITVRPAIDHLDPIRVRIEQGDVDGLILLAFDRQECLNIMLALDLPVVLVNAYNPLIGIDALVPNGRMGAMLATRYLIQCGHRRILHATRLERVTMLQRHEGYQAMLATHNIACDPNLVLPLKNFNVEDVYQQMKQFLAEHPVDYTAILAGSDEAAFGIMRALQEEQYRIPDDISIIGFNNSSMAPFASPPLTTVHIETAELGRLAVKRLLERAQFPDMTPIYLELGTHLVIRDSVRTIEED